MLKSMFGRPINATVVGGMHAGVVIITRHKGKIVLFEKQGLKSDGQGIGDLWFPSDHVNYGEELDLAAKRVLKAWGKVEPAEMKLVKVLSEVPPNEDWHLTFLFVVELKAPAKTGLGIKAIKIIEPAQLPRTVGWMQRAEIKNFLSMAGH